MTNLRVALVALSMMWTWPSQGMPLEYPLQYKPQVTSTFGTYRITHHHAGLDLTTDGNETVPVVASADGSIVRIRRSHTGYGRVVYVQHGQGRMTVYAHLSGFSPTITEVVSALPRSSSTFSFDHYLSKPLTVKKGQMLGWVGTSGTDLVHLHFELRLHGRPVNPLNHGLTIPDSMPPKIRRIRFRPISHEAHVGGSHEDFEWWVRPHRTVTVPLRGKVGVLVDAIDRIDGSDRRLTPYRIEFYIDGVLHHRTWYETTNYRHKGHTELDYDAELKAHEVGVFHRLFRHSATKLPVHSPAGATLEGLSNGLHAARIKVFDATGLADEVVFTLDVGAPKKACQLAPGELDRPLHRLPSTYFPLLRQNVYVPVETDACQRGSTVTVFIDGRPSTRWSLRTVREQSHLVIPVNSLKNQRVVVGFRAPRSAVQWFAMTTFGGGGGQEISMDPLVFKFGDKSRIEPYPMAFRTVEQTSALGLSPVTDVHTLYNGWAPARGSARVRFRLPEGLDHSKVGLFLHDAGQTWYVGSSVRSGYMVGRSVHMTGFSLMRDTRPPRAMRPFIDVHPAGHRLIIPILETGAGIRNIQLHIDGKRVAAEWQRAFSRLVYLPIANRLSGRHTLMIKAKDWLGNSLEENATFCWPSASKNCPTR